MMCQINIKVILNENGVKTGEVFEECRTWELIVGWGIFSVENEEKTELTPPPHFQASPPAFPLIEATGARTTIPAFLFTREGYFFKVNFFLRNEVANVII